VEGGGDGKGVQWMDYVRDGVELQNASQRELDLHWEIKAILAFCY
jgi:hypothetical protein